MEPVLFFNVCLDCSQSFIFPYDRRALCSTGGHLGFKCSEFRLGMSVKSSSGAGDGLEGGASLPYRYKPELPPPLFIPSPPPPRPIEHLPRKPHYNALSRQRGWRKIYSPLKKWEGNRGPFLEKSRQLFGPEIKYSNRNIKNKSAGPGQQSTPFCFINW